MTALVMAAVLEGHATVTRDGRYTNQRESNTTNYNVSFNYAGYSPSVSVIAVSVSSITSMPPLTTGITGSPDVSPSPLDSESGHPSPFATSSSATTVLADREINK